MMRRSLFRVWLVIVAILAACDGDSRPDAACAVADAPPTLAVDGRPLTIPALREWQTAAGSYGYCARSRIVVARESEDALRPVAEVFADDLQALSGRRPAIVPGEAGDAGDGDIHLALDESDARVGSEGYRLTLGTAAVIRAQAAAGAFYGTRSLLQLLRQSTRLPAGEALDWPRYPQRGLMLDIGRKYFTPGWIEARIREMAALKLNLLHLHFSETLGFRIDSETHPEIVSPAHLSKGEVRRIVASAAEHFITVVPEIGMPAHMGAALAPYPELQLADVTGQRVAGLLDVSLPEAEPFAHSLIDEYLPLFPGPYWHTGGDEYLAFYDYVRYPQLAARANEQFGPMSNGKDVVHDFINRSNRHIREQGKTTRMWNDDLDGGIAVTVDPDIVVEWWTNFSPLGDLVLIPSPQTLLDRGHSILNASWFPTYYVVGGAAGFPEGLPPRVDMRPAYESWDVHQFYGPLDTGPTQTVPATVAEDEPRNLGAKLHVWCDGPDAETEDEIAAGIAPRLRVIAQKTWHTPLLTPAYADFETIMATVGGPP